MEHDIQIGDYTCIADGVIDSVTEITNTSIRVYQKKRTNKGINCYSWYYYKDFLKLYIQKP